MATASVAKFGSKSKASGDGTTIKPHYRPYGGSYIGCRQTLRASSHLNVTRRIISVTSTRFMPATSWQASHPLHSVSPLTTGEDCESCSHAWGPRVMTSLPTPPTTAVQPDKLEFRFLWNAAEHRRLYDAVARANGRRRAYRRLVVVVVALLILAEAWVLATSPVPLSSVASASAPYLVLIVMWSRLSVGGFRMSARAVMHAITSGAFPMIRYE